MRSMQFCRNVMLILVVLGILTTFLMGCQGSLVTGKGDQILQESRIPIVAAGQHSGQYQTGDLSIDYTYLRNGANALQIGGRVTFSSSLQTNFNVVSFFNLGLILADRSGNILTQYDLATAGPINFTQGGPATINFNKTMEVLPDTATMAFKYTGQTRSDMRGAPTDFFSDPIAR